MIPRCLFLAALSLVCPALLTALTFSDWQTASFTTEQLGNAAISEATADPDGDGAANLHEYAFFGQPLTVDTNLLPVLSQAAGHLVLTYRERHDLTDVSIRLQGSDTLSNWITYNSVTEADREVFTDYDEVTLIDPQPFSSNRRFLRLRVDLLPVNEPRAPTQLSLKVVTPTSWSVGWTDPNITETGYAVEHRLPTNVWQRLSTLGADTGGWQHTAANYQTSMTYRVVAIGSGGAEAVSAPFTLSDADSDGIPDALELGSSYAGSAGTYASRPDQFSSTGTGVSDGWLVANGFNPATHDTNLDTDGDGLTDAQEYFLGTKPRSTDSDNDLMLDGWEIANGLNPADSADAAMDADGDGFTNLQEYVAGTSCTIPQTYTRTYVLTSLLLPFESDYAEITGMNDRGQVIGYANSYEDQNGYPILWTDGNAATLPFLGSLGDAYPFAINNGGEVVGYSAIHITAASSFDTDHAVRWPAAGGVFDLNIAGLETYGSSIATGINDNGLIVGRNTRGTTATAGAFKWTSQEAYTYINSYKQVNAINNQGSVLVSPYAVLHTGGVITNNDAASSPTELNNLNQVAGFYSGSAPYYFRPAFWSEAGVKTSLKIPANATSGAFVLGLNDSKEMVGYCSSADSYATYWYNGEVFDMNQILSPTDREQWFLTEAGAINKYGQIAGVGLKSGELQGFLLTPAALIADSNHDGLLSILSDKIPDISTVARPFRFAINDDDDLGDVRSDRPNPSPSANGAELVNDQDEGRVNGKWDLLDFFPVYLDIKQLLTTLPHTSGVTYKLKHEEEALNFVYTKLTRETAFGFQGESPANIFGFVMNDPAASAGTRRITASGIALSTQFLDGVKNQNWGVILVEGHLPTAKPLVLSVEKGNQVIAELKLELIMPSIRLTSEVAAADSSIHVYNPTFFREYPELNPTDIYEKYDFPACTVYYKDVVNSDFQVQDFDVDLKESPWGQNETWSKTNGPSSGAVSGQSPDFKYRNPKQGGVYELELSMRGKQTKTFLLLPLAGPEVNDFIASEMARSEPFISLVTSRYNVAQINTKANGDRWFVADNGVPGGGDYWGRPDNANARTVWKHNQVADNSGLGAIVTWFGYPTRLTKLSNFMVAYAARKIGVSDFNAWLAQLNGTPNDGSASKAWDAGWAVGGGASYQATASAAAKDIWDEQGDKNQKLWPNDAVPDNHVLRVNMNDFDRKFCSPGFIENTNP